MEMEKVGLKVYKNILSYLSLDIKISEAHSCLDTLNTYP